MGADKYIARMRVYALSKAKCLIISCLHFIQHYLTLIRYNLSLIIFGPLPDDAVAGAASAYREYSRISLSELQCMRRSYATISWQHKQVGFELGYPRKLNKLEETIQVNALVTDAISTLSTHDTPSWSTFPIPSETHQLAKVREVLKHFVRDWSQEGAEERSKTFPLILDELRRIPHVDRKNTRVLVPGSGLARLPWEIAQLGFSTTSNEISPYMNLALRFLMSRSTTYRCHQHTIRPFAHWFSHQRSNDSLFRAVTFPDVLPTLAPNSRLHHDESDFLQLRPVDGGYHYIVTHYFIDTSHNIISTLQKIYDLLRTGGTWINLGPLLWMSGGQATLELSLQEVLDLSKRIGFEVLDESRRTIVSEYTRDNAAMMRWIYETEFWIALKR